MGIRIYFSLFLPLLLALLVEGQVTTGGVDPFSLLSSFMPKKELTPTEWAGIRGAAFATGASFLQVAGLIYAARKKYRLLYSKYGEEYGDEDYEDDYGDNYEGDYEGDYEGGFRRPSTPPDSPPPPPPPPGIRLPLIPLRGPPPRLPPNERRYYSSARYKRSFQAPPPVAGNLQESVRKLLEAKDVHELIMKLAQLIQEVVDKMDVDGCLLKLLCHLQERSQDARTSEEDLLVSVFNWNDPTGAPTCGQEFSKCPVEEAQLVEAFSYMWHLQNTV